MSEAIVTTRTPFDNSEITRNRKLAEDPKSYPIDGLPTNCTVVWQGSVGDHRPYVDLVRVADF